MKALYRKYRPRTLQDVVGQQQVTEPLENALKLGKVSHAYLFIGPRGCGKTSVARIFAHAVNNFQYEIEDSYIDIIEIDGASNRGIDNIRDLREKVMIAPTAGKYKIYIIDEVHMLTKEAFNALLKTLEEPPAHAIFIMATTDAYKIPVTITSRAQTYTFKLADRAVMLNFLRSVAIAEKIEIEDDALELITRRGGGSFRDSLSLLDQISNLSKEKITKPQIISIMGLPQDEKISELLNAHVVGDATKITTILKDLLISGVKPETLTEEIIARIIEDPRPELLMLLSRLPEVQAPFAEAKLIVALCGSTQISNYPFKNNSMPVSKNGVAPIMPDGKISNIPSNNKVQKEDIKPVITSNSNDFDWNSFSDRVKAINDAVHIQLTKAEHEIDGGTLHIYPGKKIIKTILQRNEQALMQAANRMVKIVIHEETESSKSNKKDEFLTKISDIMGGEVKYDGEKSPFD